jgi:nicotinate-nucleotide pyrophosphorylase (carboxylating)
VHHLVKIEVEVSNLEEVQEALDVKADVIMLDNMTLERIREAVALINKKAVVEVSGGITIDSLQALAETGIHTRSMERTEATTALTGAP